MMQAENTFPHQNSYSDYTVMAGLLEPAHPSLLLPAGFTFPFTGSDHAFPGLGIERKANIPGIALGRTFAFRDLVAGTGMMRIAVMLRT